MLHLRGGSCEIVWERGLDWDNQTFPRFEIVFMIHNHYKFFAVALCTAAAAAADEKITYDDHVLPIFREHCLACHDSGGRSGDLSLESYADVMTGGASGDVVAAGLADESRLYNLMAHVEKPIMPPGDDRLPEKELELVKAWIDGGLLENAGSKAKKSRKPAVAAFQATADNRPAGEPAMPGGFYREPVVHSAAASAVADVAASPWAPLVAVTGQRQVLLYHADTAKLLAVVPFVVGTPEVVRFSRNGDLLLVAGGRGAALGVAHLWDIRAGERIAELGDELDTLLAADITADHTLVAMGGPRRRVQVIRTADGSLAYSITKHTDWATALEFSPDGKLLATADRSGNAYLWETTTGRPVAALAGHKAAITSMSWRSDSQLLATAADDGEVRTWQRQGNSVKQWRAGPGVQDIVFTKDGQLITASRDRLAKLWDAGGKEIRKLAGMSDIALAVAATHDAAQCVVADWTGAVKLAAIGSGEQVGTLSSNPPTLAIRIAASQAKLSEVEAQLPAAQQAAQAAMNKLSDAEAVIAKHQAAKKSVGDTMAKLEEHLGVRREALDNRRLALEQLDDTLAKLKAEQGAAETKLEQLSQQLATITNLEDEEASGEQATQLEAEIAAMQYRLEELKKKEDERAGRRPELAKARREAEQQVAAFAGQLDQQKKSLAALASRDPKLPNTQELASHRDRLQDELDTKSQMLVGLRGDIAALESEQSAYAVAQGELAADLANRQQASQDKAARLADLSQQLAAQQQQADQAAAEVEKLRQQLEVLEAKETALAKVADATEQAAGELQGQLDELSAEKAKVEKAVSDLRAAAELRARYGTGN